MNTQELYKSGELKPTQGFFYDPAIKGVDGSFLANIAGTATLSAGKILLNADTIATFVQMNYGILDFKMALPAVPTSGDAREFGFFAPNGIEKITLSIIGAVATFNVVDDEGFLTQVTIDSDLLTAEDHTVQIRWTAEYQALNIDGEDVAVTTRGVNASLPIYMKNANSDALYIYYFGIKDAGRIN